MLPYILMTSASCSFAFFAQKIKKNKALNAFFSVMAILPPVLLAAYRDVGVGTDTVGYCQRYLDYLQTMSLTKFFDLTGCEIGYGLLTYLVAIFTDNIFWMFFIIQLLIMILVWKALSNFLEGKDFVIGLLIYYLMFYSFSLNLMRQMIAMSILLYSFKYIKERKLFCFVVCLVVAVFFHRTAVLGAILYFIYWVIDSNYNKNKSKLFNTIKKYIYKFRYAVVIGIFAGAYFIVRNAAAFITFIHVYFNAYNTQYQNLNNAGLSTFRYTAYMIVLLFFLLINFKSKDKNYVYFVILFILNIIFYQLKAVSQESYRICLYFSYFIILGFPYYMGSIRLIWNKIIIKCGILLVLTVFSYDFFVLQMYNQTYPYVSSLLNWK